MKKYEIYIGLKDKETLNENFSPEKITQIISKKCKKEKIGFSITTQQGGYTHDKGYVTETSMRITLLGIKAKEVKSLGKELMQYVNTDTILITSEDCDFYFL